MKWASVQLQKSSFRSSWERFLWFFRKKYFQISLPERWEEIPAKRLPEICRILMNRVDDQDALVRIVRCLNPINPLVFFNIDPLDVVEKFTPNLTWILEKPMTANPIPTMRYRGETYQLRAGNFTDLAFHEYRALDEIYDRLVETGEEQHLNALIQTMLRSKQDFNRLPQSMKYYLLYWFMSCRQMLYEQYIKPLESEEDKTSESKSSWEDIHTDIAENGAFGDYIKVGQTNVHIIYKWLAKNRRRYLEMKKQDIQDQIKNNHLKFAQS